MMKTAAVLAMGALVTGTPVDYTPALQWGHAIEGTNFKDGYLYAVHWRASDNSTTEGNAVGRNVIGRLNKATGVAEAFFTGPAEAVFNGIEFTKDGLSMLLADVANKRVLSVKLDTQVWTVYCESADFDAGLPNDLQLNPAGDKLYLSGQDWGTNAGGLWMCEGPTSTNLVADADSPYKRTNGIAISPDANTLYLTIADGSPVAAGGSQIIKKFALKADGTLEDPNGEVFYEFTGDAAAWDTDGMECDWQGNLYATRNSGGKSVVKLSPAGELLETIATESDNPNNLKIDGSDLYVTARCNGGAWNMGDGCWEHFTIAGATDQPTDQPTVIASEPTAATAPTAASESSASTIGLALLPLAISGLAIF